MELVSFKSNMKNRSWIIIMIFANLINFLSFVLLIYFFTDFSVNSLGESSLSVLDEKVALLVIPIFLNYLASIVYIYFYIKSSQKIYLWIFILNSISMLGILLAIPFILVIWLNKDCKKYCFLNLLENTTFLKYQNTFL